MPYRCTFSRSLPALIFSLCFFSGCGSVKYLLQAGKGQLEISNRSRPIPVVLKDERTPSLLREFLAEIPEIKNYGEMQGLKATKNYTEYVDLKRPAAVWVVSACAPLKFEAKTWSFPIVGSFTYLGWFDPDDAREFAVEMKAEGWDVDVRPATAYSTLGWFKDPILSTMFQTDAAGRGELVNVVLHESVHATLYISGQSYFNESLASFIADGLTPLYLKTAPASPSQIEAYAELESEYAKRERLLRDSYLRLQQLYASALPESEKLLQKAAIFEELKKQLGTSRELSNASLIQFRTYGVGKAEFAKLLEACGGNWRRFLEVLGTLEEKSFLMPQQENFSELVLSLVPACARK